MSNGQIFFPRESPIRFELEKELLLFPRGQYADQVDALSYAALHVQQLARGSGGTNGTGVSPVHAAAEDELIEDL